jgi:hypothetical protein
MRCFIHCGQSPSGAKAKRAREIAAASGLAGRTIRASEPTARRIGGIVAAMEFQIRSSLWEGKFLRVDPNNTIMPARKGVLYVFALMGLLDSLAVAKSLGVAVGESPAQGILMIATAMGIIVWAVEDPTSCTRKVVEAQTYLAGLREFIVSMDADRL